MKMYRRGWIVVIYPPLNIISMLQDSLICSYLLLFFSLFFLILTLKVWAFKEDCGHVNVSACTVSQTSPWGPWKVQIFLSPSSNGYTDLRKTWNIWVRCENKGEKLQCQVNVKYTEALCPTKELSLPSVQLRNVQKRWFF